MQVIPAIDLRDGRCVRLLHGDFDKETEYSKDPVAIARRFAKLNTRFLHVVDLDGARVGTQANAEIVRDITTDSALNVQIGGGIRDAAAIERWLAAGAHRCVIGSLAVTDPKQTSAWISRFGPEQIVLALDVRLDGDGEPMLATHGWKETTNTSLWTCLDGYAKSGLRHVLCTDVGRDGALSGPNTVLYQSVLQRYPDVQLQASGGVRDINDLTSLRRLGASAAITGRALLDGQLSAEEVREFQQDA